MVLTFWFIIDEPSILLVQRGYCANPLGKCQEEKKSLKEYLGIYNNYRIFTAC